MISVQLIHLTFLTVKNAVVIQGELYPLYLVSASLSPLVNAIAKIMLWARTVTSANHFIMIWTEDVLIVIASHKVPWMVSLNVTKMMANVSANPTHAPNVVHNAEMDSFHLRRGITWVVHHVSAMLVVQNHKSVIKTQDSVSAEKTLLEENVTDQPMVTTSLTCTNKSTKWRTGLPVTTLLSGSASIRTNSPATA